MFLFLSKLLPLFVYPLGLSCILLLVALGLAWKQSRWFPVPIAIAFLLLVVASHPRLSDLLVRSLEWRYVPTQEIPDADAIVVLGGCIKPATYPRPMIDITEKGDRILYAAKLYHDGKAPVILVTGGRIQWGYKQLPPESEDMATLLHLLDVPDSDILQETRSLNTYQNAIYSKKILQRENLKRIILVTSALHMPRSYMIFQKQGIEAIPAPTDFLTTRSLDASPQPSLKTFLLNLIPDVAILSSTTEAMKEYIGIVVYWLRGWL
ncbi:YdcF family protein [Spirulina sp. CS-785/01]|uniref:YdcF family protein n=1 Tax=Spirulina sp. CS-785/01 TaxID=3021716 RepID=UPI0023312E94|nr:YdcF family protein [Spirulina sp. CS-785/01]MDB9313518.1 YdcF family protein [Spirulina sp. CS-785/01]